eukprot:CAMPEP_0179089620 /NCGR_PEP_ID=MMETSP0796-20121207/40845_1 /TAXON_ID=73915 /ORGANISM="Pyrodinium bahamense, Strain pbaha01" /LENGTH=167 /DNA_ID=CAMNT_0020787179 /DNA_START=199 /DNA_END=699 /DNA_ORIENTATION=-
MINHHDPPGHRTPWECERITRTHHDCAAQHENCAHLGCCKDEGYKCYRKDMHWASCRPSCKKGETHKHDPAWAKTPWDCELITRREDSDSGSDSDVHGGGDGGRPGHNEDLTQNWRAGLKSTHFWDCNGGGCDATELKPWNLREYKYAPHYAPTDPEKHGGSWYGEK